MNVRDDDDNNKDDDDDNNKRTDGDTGVWPMSG